MACVHDLHSPDLVGVRGSRRPIKYCLTSKSQKREVISRGQLEWKVCSRPVFVASVGGRSRFAWGQPVHRIAPLEVFQCAVSREGKIGLCHQWNRWSEFGGGKALLGGLNKDMVSLVVLNIPRTPDLPAGRRVLTQIPHGISHENGKALPRTNGAATWEASTYRIGRRVRVP